MDSRCELLTVIEGAHAGEKALYIDGRIRVASGSAWADEINENDNSIVMFKQQIGSRPRLIILSLIHISMMVAATTQPSHVCTTCIPMLLLKKLPKGRLVQKCESGI